VALRDASLGPSTLALCEDRIRAAVAKEKNIRLSAAEFFIDNIESRLLNHKGLDVSQEESFIQTEFILLATNGTTENEYINRTTRRFGQDLDLEREVAQSALFARDATAASLPKTGSFPVLLSDEPLDQLFNPLIARASARLKYNKMVQTELGQSVVEKGTVKGDHVTLWSNGTLDRLTGSARFDTYGTPLGRVCLIERNNIKAYLADKRYADYLGLPVTGEMGNVEVDPGSASFEKLSDPSNVEGTTIYHLQAFSAFEPNAIRATKSRKRESNPSKADRCRAFCNVIFWIAALHPSASNASGHWSRKAFFFPT
jgi:predicted Zn-dependent protease